MPRPRPFRYFQCVKYKNAYHYGRLLEQIRLFLSGLRKGFPYLSQIYPQLLPFLIEHLAKIKLVIDQEILDLLHEGFIERCLPGYVPHFVSPIKAVPKAAGSDKKWRLIIDLRVLNSFLNPPKFSNESIKIIESLVEPITW